MEALRLRPDELRWREIDGEIVAVDVATSTYLSANPAGALLWQMLVAGATEEELAAKLVEEFAIDDDRARSDASAFVAALRARGLLE